MARKTRISFEGAIYHVMARGNERARIFHSEEEYGLFLKTLGEALDRFGVDLHAYCLMPNHFHLAVQTPRGNLPRFMAWLQTTFTVRYNRIHRRNGHLFQGRYRAELVEDASYGMWLVLYIHLNPVRRRKDGVVKYVGTLEELNRFRWSSHRAWMGIEKSALPRMRCDWLEEWAKTRSSARKAYLRSIRSEMNDQKGLDWKLKVEMGLAAGSEAFLEKTRKWLAGRGRETGSAEWGALKAKKQRKLMETTLNQERDLKIKLWLRVKLLGESQVALAKELGYASSAGVYLVVRRLDEAAKKDSSLNEKLLELGKLYNVVD